MWDSVRSLFGALMVISSVASVCGNLLLLLLLLLNKDLRSDSLGLTLSTSLSDLVLGLSSMPFGAFNSLAGGPWFLEEGALCQGSGFVLVLLQTSSLHSLAWTTVHRFTQICLGLSHGSLWTGARTRAVLVLLWAFSLLFAALPLLGLGGFRYQARWFLCGPRCSAEGRVWVGLWAAGGVLAPLLAVCLLSGGMVLAARRQARRGTFRCNQQHCFYVPANQYLRSTVVMVTHTVCVLLCWLPHLSVCMYETFGGLLSSPVFSTISLWFVLTNAALNPWITCLLQTRFRAALRLSFTLIQRWTCPSEEPRPQRTVLHLSSTNHISTTTQPPASPKSTITPPPVS